MTGGDTAVEKLRWGGGRPLKVHGLTQQEIDDIVSKPRLIDEIGMSLQAKACKVTHETGKQVNADQIRKLYSGRGITRQFPMVRPGKPKPDTYESQLTQITTL